MNHSYKIKKAKLVDGLYLDAEYKITEADGDETMSSTINLSSQRIVHQDLKNAFLRLTPHLALLTEIVDIHMVEYEELYEEESFKNFEVRSFTIGGSDDQEGVVISGLKKLRGKRVLNINTPFTKFDPELDQSEYPYILEMHRDVQKLIDEVVQYLEGKHAPKAQLELFNS